MTADVDVTVALERVRDVLRALDEALGRSDLVQQLDDLVRNAEEVTGKAPGRRRRR
jgi:hypothetical protein